MAQIKLLCILLFIGIQSLGIGQVEEKPVFIDNNAKKAH